MPRRNLENLQLGGNALEGSLPKPANLRDVASLQCGLKWREELQRRVVTWSRRAAARRPPIVALSRALDDATLWLGGDVRPWKKLAQDDERKGAAGWQKKDDDIGSDMLKEMRRAG